MVVCLYDTGQGLLLIVLCVMLSKIGFVTHFFSARHKHCTLKVGWNMDVNKLEQVRLNADRSGSGWPESPVTALQGTIERGHQIVRICYVVLCIFWTLSCCLFSYPSQFLHCLKLNSFMYL